MHIRDRIALILLAGGAVVAFATASSGAKHIRPAAIVPRDTMRAAHRGETKAEIAGIREVERQDPRQSRIALRSQDPPVPPGSSERNSTETTREKKTLALLLLMLRDGRRAR